jgi:prepilin-type N-terminal cleavage/methylation domain-containing protein
MSRIRQARELRDEGFTLIELLIVIVVLGILAGIVVFGVGTFRTDSQTAACKADLKTVSVAADAWNAKFGGYFEVANMGPPPVVGPLTTNGLTVQDLVDTHYLKSLPDVNNDGTIAIATADGAVTQVGGPADCTIAN